MFVRLEGLENLSKSFFEKTSIFAQVRISRKFGKNWSIFHQTHNKNTKVERDLSSRTIERIIPSLKQSGYTKIQQKNLTIELFCLFFRVFVPLTIASVKTSPGIF